MEKKLLECLLHFFNKHAKWTGHGIDLITGKETTSYEIKGYTFDIEYLRINNKYKVNVKAY